MKLEVRSIRTKILLAIVAAVFALQVVSTGAQYYQTSSLLINVMEVSALTVATPITQDITDQLSGLTDLNAKKNFLESYAELKGETSFPPLLTQVGSLQLVNFVDASGKIIAGDGLDGQISAEAAKLVVQKKQAATEAANRVIVFVPLYDHADFMGGLVFYFSNSVINQQRLNLLAIALAIFIANLLIGFLISVFVSTRITRTLKNLVKGTKEISKGNLDYIIDVKTEDEIGQLALGFNQMTKNLLESRQVLEGKMKELSQEHGKLSSLVESVRLGVVMVDLRLSVILANSAARTIFGKADAKDLSFKDISQKIKGSINISQALSYYVHAGKPLNIQEVMIDESYYRLFMSPVRDIVEKIFIGAVVVMEDITEQKKLDKMRTEIVSITSHQLRTPATIVKGNLEMVLGGDVGKVTKAQKELLDDTYMGNERMIHLINDLMDAAKINEGKLIFPLAPVELEDVVNEVVNENQAFAKEKNVKLSFTKPPQPLPSANINRDKIKQVFQNLIDNAIKYSSVGDKGHVTVSVANDDDRAILFSVKDNGIGIPKADQGKMFERFSRGSNSTKLDPGGGSGLGLYIAKAVVEQSDGKIWFESKEGEGTSFYVSFPIH